MLARSELEEAGCADLALGADANGGKIEFFPTEEGTSTEGKIAVREGKNEPGRLMFYGM